MTERRPDRQVILDGKTALIIGMGEVGTRVAKACIAMASGDTVFSFRSSSSYGHNGWFLRWFAVSMNAGYEGTFHSPYSESHDGNI